jgi:hypothetical protein
MSAGDCPMAAALESSMINAAKVKRYLMKNPLYSFHIHGYETDYRGLP